MAAGSLIFPNTGQGSLRGPHTAAVRKPTSVPAAVKAPPESAAAASQVATCGPSSVFQQLIQQFPAVVNPSKILPAATHGVQHHIVTRGPPVSSKFCHLDGEKLAAAKAEFTALERDGITRRSASPWASPLYLLRKPDSSWRPLWRLPPFEPRHGSRRVPASKHAGFRR